jgi:hypothetical protein
VIGSRTVNVVPFPTRFPPKFLHPWPFTNSLVKLSPMPVPPVLCFFAALVGLVKTVENVGQIFWWDAHAVVGDRQNGKC